MDYSQAIQDMLPKSIAKPKQPIARVIQVTQDPISTPTPAATSDVSVNEEASDKQRGITKYQQWMKTLETSVKDIDSRTENMTHEYGYSENFMIERGNYRIISIETGSPIMKSDLIFISLISDDGNLILGGLINYLLPYIDNDKVINVVVENHSDDRICRINYHKCSEK